MKNNKLSKRLELDGDPLTNEKIFRRNFTTIFIFLPLFPLFLGSTFLFHNFAQDWRRWSSEPEKKIRDSFEKWTHSTETIEIAATP